MPWLLSTLVDDGNIRTGQPSFSSSRKRNVPLFFFYSLSVSCWNQTMITSWNKRTLMQDDCNNHTEDCYVIRLFVIAPWVFSHVHTRTSYLCQSFCTIIADQVPAEIQGCQSCVRSFAMPQGLSNIFHPFVCDFTMSQGQILNSNAWQKQRKLLIKVITHKKKK